MTELVSYSTGTVSVSAGGTTVTGVGTIWSGVNARPGDIFQIGNYQSVISDVVDTGTLTIPPWGGGAQTAVAYKIWQVSPQRFAGAQAMADVSTLVGALNTSGFFVFVDTAATVPDPSLGNDGQYAFQPTTGKTWVKSAGAWSYLGIYKAFRFMGAYNNATTYSLGDLMTDAGSSYVWINPTSGSGHPAPDTTYWQLVASKGDTGATGATGAAGTNGTNGAGYGGTSTTSLTIGTGSQAFTTQAGLAYTNGARVRASSAANTANWMEGLATYSGTTLTIVVDKTNGSGTLADWNFNVVGQPGAGDLSSANNLSDLANKSTARDNLQVPQSYGQCRLTLSGGNLVLSPLNGNLLTVNGVPSVVPDAGVSLAATGLTPSTNYFIYATASGGTVNALEASTTAHATSTAAGNKGTEIKSGDNTRTLVGFARVVTGPAWVDTKAQRFVRTWFNGGGVETSNSLTTLRTTSSTSPVELHTEIRNELLLWAGESLMFYLSGAGYNSGVGGANWFGIAIDNTATIEPSGSYFNSPAATYAASVGANGQKHDLAEGYHYVTLLCWCSAGTLSVVGGGSATVYTTVSTQTRRH